MVSRQPLLSVYLTLDTEALPRSPQSRSGPQATLDETTGFPQQRSNWLRHGVACRVYMVFIISQILSPILPVALNVGQMNAMERLKKKGINCLNAKRIAISGKVRQPRPTQRLSS